LILYGVGATEKRSRRAGTQTGEALFQRTRPDFISDLLLSWDGTP
jgi:hypothetical protein